VLRVRVRFSDVFAENAIDLMVTQDLDDKS